MNFGLLGRNLRHSYSPQIHSLLGNYPYDLVEVEPENLAEFMNHTSLSGFNVTMPYKKDVVPFCKTLSDEAKKLGAVNTVVKDSSGNWVGYNTDYFGFSYMVDRSGLSVANKKVLVLGNGGASVTTVAVLKELGADVIVISRTGDNNYDTIDDHADAAILVNTTPLGMYPNMGISPVNLDIFDRLEGVLDVVYNPARTELLLQAEKRGLIAINGLSMLVAQAKESAQLFLRQKIDDTITDTILTTLQKLVENIILIGMPGCGKSTIGKGLADVTGREFVDSDAEIAKKAKKTIPEIFHDIGEAGFRKLENDVLQAFGKQSGLIIATGGGCVTKAENYSALHQNGKIIWLKRELAKLPNDGRPLSQTVDIGKLYETRKFLYEAFADHSIENCGAPEDTVTEILRTLALEVL